MSTNNSRKIDVPDRRQPRAWCGYEEFSPILLGSAIFVLSSAMLFVYLLVVRSMVRLKLHKTRQIFYLFYSQTVIELVIILMHVNAGLAVLSQSFTFLQLGSTPAIKWYTGAILSYHHIYIAINRVFTVFARDSRICERLSDKWAVFVTVAIIWVTPLVVGSPMLVKLAVPWIYFHPILGRWLKGCAHIETLFQAKSQNETVNPFALYTPLMELPRQIKQLIPCLFYLIIFAKMRKLASLASGRENQINTGSFWNKLENRVILVAACNLLFQTIDALTWAFLPVLGVPFYVQPFSAIMNSGITGILLLFVIEDIRNDLKKEFCPRKAQVGVADAIPSSKTNPSHQSTNKRQITVEHA